MYLVSTLFKDAEMAFISYVCINLFITINTIISTAIIYFLGLTNQNNTVRMSLRSGLKFLIQTLYMEQRRMIITMHNTPRWMKTHKALNVNVNETATFFK